MKLMPFSSSSQNALFKDDSSQIMILCFFKFKHLLYSPYFSDNLNLKLKKLEFRRIKRRMMRFDIYNF